MKEQTEAQRLIEWIEDDTSCTGDKEIVAELRRLEAANAELLAALKRILGSAEGEISEAPDDCLREISQASKADHLTREQAAAILQSRAAIANHGGQS